MEVIKALGPAISPPQTPPPTQQTRTHGLLLTWSFCVFWQQMSSRVWKIWSRLWLKVEGGGFLDTLWTTQVNMEQPDEQVRE